MGKEEFTPDIEIKNRKAAHLYFLGESFEAGIVLKGTEIKSIRKGSVSMGDAFCYFHEGELYVKNLHISEYKYGSPHTNHEPRRERKLLLRKHQLRKMHRQVTQKGATIVPIRLFINERGIAKLDIAIATGKKSHDKRETIKKRDQKREMERAKQNFRR